MSFRTCACSALVNGQTATVDVVRAGFSRGHRRQRNERQLVEFLDEPRVNVIDVDDDTIAARAELKVAYLYDYKKQAPPDVKKGDSALFAALLFKW